jgi:hypothetical protein
VDHTYLLAKSHYYTISFSLETLILEAFIAKAEIVFTLFHVTCLNLVKRVLKAYQFCPTNIKTVQVMQINFLTKEDLQDFKQELLSEMKELLNKQQKANPSQKKWLKSTEVKKLLGLSAGTILNLRVNGTLPYSKVGGIILYDYEEIMKIIQSKKIHNGIFRS